jgi:hypothetical protein
MFFSRLPGKAKSRSVSLVFDRHAYSGLTRSVWLTG